LSNSRRAGIWYGLLGSVSFSLTLPATRAAVLYLHPWVVALGRPVIAAILAAGLLIATGQRLPERRYWKSFAIVVCSIVFGVPLLFAWGMDKVPASHGGITLGLLPLATALGAVLRAGERPSARFWIASVVGSLSVVVFAMNRGSGRLHWGDLILFLSVVASAVGYVEGARLTRVFTGWQVISWALVMGSPFLVVPLALAVRRYGLAAPPLAWGGFFYLCVVSQFAGLFAWYKGLALGGIARVGQLQLLQPFCTLLFSALFLGESITLAMLLAAAVVVASVAIGKNAPIQGPHRPLTQDSTRVW
jgi:drug/metabolite transporter (DMT)-like permease